MKSIRNNAVVVMAKRRWFYMSAGTFERARPACEELHGLQYPGSDLRILWNDDMSACLICLDGASKEWRAPQAWVEECREVYCRSSYPGLGEIDEDAVWRTAAVECGGQIVADQANWADDDLWDDL